MVQIINMKKRTPSKTVGRNNTELADETNIKKGEGNFTFPNGDSYKGGYMIIKNKRVLVKQDHGTYITDNFDTYEATWNNDQISTNLHVRHNNGMEYKGEVNANGEMNGRGIYVFPDGASLEAIWSHDKPTGNIIYKEPLGFIWKGDCVANEIRFVAGNHFWDEVYVENKTDLSVIASETD